MWVARMASSVARQTKQELVLVTTVGDVPDITRQAMTIGARRVSSSLKMQFYR
jgi:hypothetical protein